MNMVHVSHFVGTSLFVGANLVEERETLNAYAWK